MAICSAPFGNSVSHNGDDSMSFVDGFREEPPPADYESGSVLCHQLYATTGPNPQLRPHLWSPFGFLPQMSWIPPSNEINSSDLYPAQPLGWHHPQFGAPPPGWHHSQFGVPPPGWHHSLFAAPAPWWSLHDSQQFRPRVWGSHHANSGFLSRPPNEFCPPQHSRPPPPTRPADFRDWVYSTELPPRDERFTVLSYNILADGLATKHRHETYFHIPEHILEWEWRKRRILIEFGLWSPDILCLQEVDRYFDLEQELLSRGFHGTWKKRTGDSQDGCAMFWRSSRFELLTEESIEFSKLGLRNNVAQICVLQTKAGSNGRAESSSKSLPTGRVIQSMEAKRIVVCNIHVLYNAKRGEVKLGQVRTLIDRAYTISRHWDNAPVVICGDFNCTPKSPLYNFISTQQLYLPGLARTEISGQGQFFSANSLPNKTGDSLSNQFTSNFEDKLVLFSGYDPYSWTPVESEVASGNKDCTLLRHNLKLRSAYVEVGDHSRSRDSSGEPQVTSYNRRFMGTVDYIWFSDGLQAVKVLNTIPKDVLQRTDGFPTAKWGSDHIAIVCELAFLGNNASIPESGETL